MPKKQDPLHPHGHVVGVEKRDGAMFLSVFVHEGEHAERVWLSHEMQLQVLGSITEHLAHRVRELAWIKAGHPVPSADME